VFYRLNEESNMATQAKSGLEKWKDGIRKAAGDPKWNRWDCEIQQVVIAYNSHLRNTPGYVPLDWKVVKAMLWTESGAHKPDWNRKPMQIGNYDDPGLPSFLSGKESGDLIIVPAWKGLITMGSARTNPIHNLRAGVGYLLMRHAHYAHKSIPDANDKVHEVTVKSGDSLEKIAKANGSTVEVLQKLNPDTKVLRVGRVLKYQKAAIQKVITGWKAVTPLSVALLYNSMTKDPYYAERISHAFKQVKRAEAGQCTQ
jgi:hypothetical protein